MARWWMEGGVWMWVVLMLALVALPVAAGAGMLALVGRFRGGAALTGGRVVAVLALGLALTPGCAGVAGWLHGRSIVDSVLPLADPDQREILREVGYAEARRPLELAGLTAVPLFGLACVALLLALPPTRNPEAS
jgi:hypothetical protein